MYQRGHAIGEEARGKGVNIILGPTVRQHCLQFPPCSETRASDTGLRSSIHNTNMITGWSHRKKTKRRPELGGFRC
jgi:beta-glucosidase-like glycosyl hydrolase